MDFEKQISLNASNKTSLWMILFILAAGSFFSAIIPPFQSPDEFDHISRAYLFSKGTIVLDAPKGKDTGGMIDTGLMAYMSAYEVLPRKRDRKLSADEIYAANRITWKGTKAFRALPGISYYFPVIYTPQAVGLTLGEKLKLSVDTSYRLARFMALVFVAIILIIAFNIYPVNPLTIALLMIPMSVFQMSSASQDGISVALGILAIATFLRMTTEKQNTSPWLFYILTFSVALVATSRPFLLPLLILVFAACFYTGDKKSFCVFAAAAFFIIPWLGFTMHTTVDSRFVAGHSTSDAAVFYLQHPLQFFHVLWATLSRADLVNFYGASFLGYLGWLDTPFSPKEYKVFFICIILIGLLSVSAKNFKKDWFSRSLLVFSALISILLIFFAILIKDNQHPASLIQGVQGRYFLIPMIMVAYAVSGSLKLYEGIFRKIALCLVIFLGLFTIFSTPKLLIERYYLAPLPLEEISVQYLHSQLNGYR
ncbi:MAG TPA: DUF2142 domain-containing protein [Smithella sp.]|nr:DUF2142 domain-containing protein [Smithella sp.]